MEWHSKIHKRGKEYSSASETQKSENVGVDQERKWAERNLYLVPDNRNSQRQMQRLPRRTQTQAHTKTSIK